MSKAKVLVVTSGKGSVGKTTSTAALGAALAQAGQNVVVVDFDVGLPISIWCSAQNVESNTTSPTLCRISPNSRSL